MKSRKGPGVHTHQHVLVCLGRKDEGKEIEKGRERKALAGRWHLGGTTEREGLGRPLTPPGGCACPCWLGWLGLTV